MNEQVFKEWLIILRMIMKEDLSIYHLRNLCIEYKTDFNNCFNHLYLIEKMSYVGARKFVNDILQNYVNSIPINQSNFLPPAPSVPPVPPLQSKRMISLNIYEFQATNILCKIKNGSLF